MDPLRLAPKTFHNKRSSSGDTLCNTRGSLWCVPRSKSSRYNGSQKSKKTRASDSLREKSSMRHPQLNGTTNDESIGRKCRLFTVVKVNNGGIYLGPTAGVRSPGKGDLHPRPHLTATLNTSTPIPPYIRVNEIPKTPSLSNLPTLSPISSVQTHQRSHSDSARVEKSPKKHDSAQSIKEGPDDTSTYSPTAKNFQFFPTIEISIPSYRLGSPCFNILGTAILQNSSLNTSTTELSQDKSSGHRNRVSMAKCESTSYPENSSLSFMVEFTKGEAEIPLSNGPNYRPPFASGAYNQLDLKSLRDDPSVVRYAINGRIRAASPARLVVEITSPRVIDYDFLSDFFLTFRSFLKASDLIQMLISRLNWALLRNDAIGTVVRVRTFVAIRHWILNYFHDDFEPDWELRRLFCDLVNDLTDKMSKQALLSKVHLKIISELKKCWRRICAVFWKTPNSDLDACVMDPIFPGGSCDFRSTFSTSHVAEKNANQSFKVKGTMEADSMESGITLKSQGLGRDVTQQFKPKSVRTSTLYTSISSKMDLPPSPTSIKSEELVSWCHLTESQDKQELSLSDFKTPADSPQSQPQKSSQVPEKYPLNSLDNTTGPPQSIREVECQNKTPYEKFPYMGSLVGGNQSPLDNITAYPWIGLENQKDIEPGPKRSFGCALRILCNKKGQVATSSSNAQICLRSIPSNRPSDAPLNQYARSEIISLNFPLRFDLLGVEVAKALNQVIKEDKDVGMKKRTSCRRKSSKACVHNAHSGERSPSQTTAMSGSIFVPEYNPIRSSESQDVTGISDFSSGDLSALSCNQSNGPTPPNTPPGLALDLPQCDSRFVGIDVRERSLSVDEAPSLIGDSYPSLIDDASLRLSTEALSEIRFSFNTEIPQRRNNSIYSGIARWTSQYNSFSANTSDGAELQQLEHLSNLVSSSLLVRPLRRRPGGNLREAMNNSENQKPGFDGRPRSSDLHSCSYTGSSDFLDQGSSTESESPNDKFSREKRPEPQRRSHFSPSSSPLTELSFLNEAQILAQIPDDEDDDGGVESALMKLEGKFPEKSAPEPSRLPQTSTSSGPNDTLKRKNRDRAFGITPPKDSASLKTYRPKRISESGELEVKSYQPQGMITAICSPTPSQSFESSRSSNSSTSLHSGYRIINSYYQALNGQSQISDTDDSSDEHSSADTRDNLGLHLQNTLDYMHRLISHEADNPDKLRSNDVPLPQESETESDVSSLSDHYYSRAKINVNVTATVNNRSSPTSKASKLDKKLSNSSIQSLQPRSKMSKTSKKLREGSCVKNGIALDGSDADSNSHEVDSRKLCEKNLACSRGATPSMNPLKLNLISKTSDEKSCHLPFILAFDSDTLAKQFTLVEKDVVGEIYWRDLIDINCVNAFYDLNSWVEFLKSQDPVNGVEVVVARFNLVVKWAISECVLTRDLDERIHCFTKLIHLAAKCRKYRNFATSAQITTALTSPVICSMSSTWAHVPEADIQTLRDLNTLFTSSDEFHNLRAEMEGTGADQGCIPVVGVYTNDLLVIGEKPSRIPNKSSTESLVNFEKCRASATAVKNLLRLLDTRERYQFSSVDGVFERCLWIATLSDAEILKHRNMIQN